LRLTGVYEAWLAYFGLYCGLGRVGSFSPGLRDFALNCRLLLPHGTLVGNPPQDHVLTQRTNLPRLGQGFA
jgi:hypothetical protein